MMDKKPRGEMSPTAETGTEKQSMTEYAEYRDALQVLPRIEASITALKELFSKLPSIDLSGLSQKERIHLRELFNEIATADVELDDAQRQIATILGKTEYK